MLAENISVIFDYLSGRFSQVYLHVKKRGENCRAISSQRNEHSI
jgi:hypothetical protein